MGKAGGETSPFVRAVLPKKFRTMLLNRVAMENTLLRAPMEFTKTPEEANIQIELPLPDGGFARFFVMESPILPPKLAKKYPSIRTYSIQGIDDPTATGRVELTSSGCRALILTDHGKGSFAIDPYWQNNPLGNVSYYLKESGLRMGDCLMPPPKLGQTKQSQASRAASLIGDNNGSSWGSGSVRLVRLAIACSGEFAQQVSGNPADLETTLAFIAGVANQVSAILDRDFNLRFQLVEEQDSIIFLDPETDPYPGILDYGENDAKLAEANQQTIDAEVGPSNYEFGHLLLGDLWSWGVSTGSLYGDVFGILGDDTRKAMCMSARGSSDFNQVNFNLLVAHEMGHGLNANHTFSFKYIYNGNTYGYEGTGAQVEPGSGSTIMSYAGITDANLQAGSDNYYNSKSLEQMIFYASSAPGNAAHRHLTNGNFAPQITPLKNYTIPARTPFYLAVSATDTNDDSMTYCWEQVDSAIRAKNPTLDPRDDGSSPLFRSFPPTNNPVRLFPQLKYILSHTNIPPPGSGLYESTNFATGEFLPTTTRDMTFRVTVRDNSSSGGGIAFATCRIKSVGTAGPFAITNFNNPETLVGNRNATLRWNIANTGPGTPVNCPQVKISLSTNEGTHFSQVLTNNAPNSGSCTFLLPDVNTTQARFKVEAVGNIFFDISDVNLTIIPPTTPTISSNPSASPITFGQALSNSILSGGSASTPGSFTWTTPTNRPNAGINLFGVTFTPSNTYNFNQLTTNIAVTVNKATPALRLPSASPITFGQTLSNSVLSGGSASSFGANVPGSFAWQDSSIAPSAGKPSATIIFTPSNPANFNSVTTNITVTVNKARPNLTWNPLGSTTYGTPLSTNQLNATSTLAGTYTYNPTNGALLDAKTHTLSVTFRPTDSNNYLSPITTNVSLVVTKATTVISSLPTISALTFGHKLEVLKLTNGSASVPGTFSWVTPSTIPPVPSSSQLVRFTPNNQNNYGLVTSSITVTVNKATPLIPWNNPSAITYGTALSGTQLNANSSVPGSFAYSPTSGTKPNAGTNILTAVFTANDSANYLSPRTNTVSLVVNKATPTIATKPTATAITFGQALSNSVLSGGSASLGGSPVPGTFAFTTPSAAPNAGTANHSVTFTPTDSANHNTATTTIAVTVNKPTPSIASAPSASTISYGQALSSSVLSGGSASYGGTPVPGTFAWVTPTTKPSAGSSTQSIRFTPNNQNNYGLLTSSITVTVNQATPLITWNNPSAITYGTALSGTQLNANSSVPGSFAYSPTSGTKPNAGTNILTAVFTANDSANYLSPRTNTVSLVVNKATPTIATKPTATAITFGQALSNSVLSGGSASLGGSPVPGTFAWVISSTKPAKGTSQQNVRFAPSDTNNLNNATSSVSVKVN